MKISAADLPRPLKICFTGLLYGGTIFGLYALLVRPDRSFDSTSLAVIVGMVSAVAYITGASGWSNGSQKGDSQ